MKKKVFALLAAVAVVLSASFACVTAFADDVSWKYDSSSKTLTVYGSGKMDDYADEYSAPWHSYTLEIENVVVSDGVTSVGNYAFSGAEKLHSVSLADSVLSIGTNSFGSCKSLNSLALSENVVSIGDYSFAYNGVDAKSDFALCVKPGSYALNFCRKNSIKFECDNIKCGVYDAVINPGGMTAFYPYSPKCNGSFTFKSSGPYDTEGFLYDENFKILASNDDISSSDTDFSLTYSLEKGKKYYFGAKINSFYQTSNKGEIKVTLSANGFDVSGTVYALGDKNGNPSDIVVTNALIDGTATDNGTFSFNVTGGTKQCTITADNATKTVIFTPDSETDVAVLMCDVNNDRIVNGKDFVQMLHTESKYVSLCEPLLNYQY